MVRALENWLAAFREGNPQLFEVFFWALVLILVMVLVHASYVMFQTTARGGSIAESRPRSRQSSGTQPGTATGRGLASEEGFSRRCR